MERSVQKRRILIRISLYTYVGTAIQALVVERCRTSLQDRLKMEWLKWRRE